MRHPESDGVVHELHRYRYEIGSYGEEGCLRRAVAFHVIQSGFVE